MTRENTHTVIKNDDAKKYLSESQKRELDNILLSINNGRISDNKSINTYLIVNKDEPYAEKIQDMIIFEESKKYSYQQGRADQKKEDNEFFNFDKVIEIEKNKSYQQGKADREKELSELPNEYSEKLWKIAYQKGETNGAREFAEWCYINGINFSECSQDDCDNCNRIICTNCQTFVDVVLAEWQKEQKK